MAEKPTYEELEQRVKQLEQAELKRKRAAKALQESKDRYRGIVEDTPALICSFLPGGEITFVNKAYCEYFDKTSEELVGSTFLSLIAEADRETVMVNISALTIESPTQSHEQQVVAPGGDIRWQLWTDRALFDAQGKVVAYQSTGEDITERKQVEKTLKESEKRFHLFMNNSPAVTFMKDIEGNYVYFSQRYFEVWGEQAKEWIGKSDEELWSSEIAEQYRRNDAAILAKDKPIEVIETWETTDGPTQWRTYKFPVRDASDKLVYLAGMAVDITKQKKLEARLQQAQKMEAIGTFAGGITHDFNNILSSVIGFTELALADVERNTVLEERLQAIYTAWNRAKDLVKQILTFSRQAEQEHKPVHVKLIVKEALKFLRASIPATIEKRWNIQSDALVMADPTQIHQILMNLCTNAEHAMREKGGVMKVKLEDVELDAEFTAGHPDIKPGAYLNLTVSDTGHGIPPDVLERIFDPFFTTKEVGEGTGMGLSVVHGIIGSYGGAITVDSEPGQGSTFKVYLPIIERREKPQATMEDPIPTGSERILFVDDEPVLANLGQQILESLGYDVDIRTGSIEALELFKAQPDRFDLVFSDMTMPNMTGEDLAQELMHIKPNIPIILCTGFSAKIDDQKASAMGIRAFVLKPIVKREIATTVRKVLDGK